VTSLCRAASGNCAYLTAYARSLEAASQAAPGGADTLDELLSFEALPSGLYPLYAAFVRRIRKQIESMGQLDVASPRGRGDKLVAPWEGAGQRVVAVLAVARGPLSLDQIVALGELRVWKSAANDVLRSFVPFLDSTREGWRLFHASVGEFLTAADEHVHISHGCGTSCRPDVRTSSRVEIQRE
jgi:hypothetical protein